MAEEKAAKAFVEAANNRNYNPYHFVNLVKTAGGYPAAMLHKVAIGWFMLNEIDWRYGIGDPVVGEMASRIMHEVVNDYEEVPDYNPGRGFASGGTSPSGTIEDYQSRYAPSFVQRGAE